MVQSPLTMLQSAKFQCVYIFLDKNQTYKTKVNVLWFTLIHVNQNLLNWQTKQRTLALPWWFELSTKPHEAKDFMIYEKNRRKFRSQTSDNMDRWKNRGGKSQRREEKRKSQKKEDVGARKRDGENACLCGAKHISKSNVLISDAWDSILAKSGQNVQVL